MLASFASAKVVIDTLCMSPIEYESVIQVENEGFRIAVFEAKTEFTIFHLGTGVEDISSCSMKAKVSQKKMGGGSSSGEMTSQANLAQEDWQKKQSHTDERSGSEGEQSPEGQSYFKSISNTALGVGQLRLSTNGIINFASCTKAVSFSRKGDIEEAIKLSLEDGVIDPRRKNSADGTDILSPTNHINKHSMPRNGVSLQLPLVGSERSVSVEPPPGFEAFDARDIERSVSVELPPAFEDFDAGDIEKEITNRKKMVLSKER